MVKINKQRKRELETDKETKKWREEKRRREKKEIQGDRPIEQQTD